MATVTIRIDDETRDRIAEEAAARGVNVSTYIRETLELHLSMEAPEGEGGRPDTNAPLGLTEYQRKVLQMLHRITLAAQGDLDKGYYSPDSEVQMIKMLEGGYSAEYPREFADILGGMSMAECEQVWDVLDMFRVIGSSVKEHGGWDKLGIRGAERYGTFQGFDLNDSVESRMLDYARYLLKSGRWTEQEEVFGQENDYGNSHASMLSRYRSMLREFKPRWRTTVRGWDRNLSVEDLRAVLLAAPGAQAVED